MAGVPTAPGLRVPSDNPIVHDFLNGSDALRSSKPILQGNLAASQPRFHLERDFRFYSELNEARSGQIETRLEPHVVEQSPAVGCFNSQRALHRSGGQAELPADNSSPASVFFWMNAC